MTTTLATVESVLKSQGIERYAAGHSFGDQPEHVTSFREDWQHRYFSAGYLNKDPLPPIALETSRAMRWSDLRKMFPNNDVLNEACFDFGMTEGFAMSIGDLVISAETAGKLTDADLTFLDGELRAAVQRAEGPANDLTAKQSGLIMLAAQGKSLDEMAALSGVSRDAVNSMMARTRDRLGARTTAQAVAIAQKLRCSR